MRVNFGYVFSLFKKSDTKTVSDNRIDIISLEKGQQQRQDTVSEIERALGIETAPQRPPYKGQ